MENQEVRAALVVGGASGIGAATVERLSRDGWRVLAVGSRDGEAGRQALQHLDVAYAQADMSAVGGPQRAVDEAIRLFGRLDAVMYSAGATVKIPHADLDAVDDAVWDRILELNLKAPWAVVKAAAPELRKATDASITFVGALGGVDVGGSSIPYAVSKAALHHMVKLLGAVLGPEVRINAVAPGLVDTPWTGGDAWDGLREHVRSTAPLRRVGTPDDIADAIAGLMQSRYTTGQTVVVDGGLSLVP